MGWRCHVTTRRLCGLNLGGAEAMSNKFFTNSPVDFWVWINPDNFLVRNQITVTGGFASGGLMDTGRNSNLMFIPNPEFRGDITPFQHGVVREYLAEYNLELSREAYFNEYPSRLNSIYLFLGQDDAELYSERYKWHVGDRILKKCHSVGPAQYSVHDCSWVDFLRQSNMINPDSINNVGRAYWNGHRVQDCKLKSMGKSWTQDEIKEVLFVGRIEFYDRNLDR